MAKAIKVKKAAQLKLSSMSDNWQGNPPKKSGKHNSQIIQRMKRRLKRLKKQNP